MRLGATLLILVGPGKGWFCSVTYLLLGLCELAVPQRPVWHGQTSTSPFWLGRSFIFSHAVPAPPSNCILLPSPRRDAPRKSPTSIALWRFCSLSFYPPHRKASFHTSLIFQKRSLGITWVEIRVSIFWEKKAKKPPSFLTLQGQGRDERLKRPKALHLKNQGMWEGLQEEREERNL